MLWAIENRGRRSQSRFQSTILQTKALNAILSVTRIGVISAISEPISKAYIHLILYCQYGTHTNTHSLTHTQGFISHRCIDFQRLYIPSVSCARLTLVIFHDMYIQNLTLPLPASLQQNNSQAMSQYFLSGSPIRRALPLYNTPNGLSLPHIISQQLGLML